MDFLNWLVILFILFSALFVLSVSVGFLMGRRKKKSFSSSSSFRSDSSVRSSGASRVSARFKYENISPLSKVPDSGEHETLSNDSVSSDANEFNTVCSSASGTKSSQISRNASDMSFQKDDSNDAAIRSSESFSLSDPFLNIGQQKVVSSRNFNGKESENPFIVPLHEAKCTVNSEAFDSSSPSSSSFASSVSSSENSLPVDDDSSHSPSNILSSESFDSQIEFVELRKAKKESQFENASNTAVSSPSEMNEGNDLVQNIRFESFKSHSLPKDKDMQKNEKSTPISPQEIKNYTPEEHMRCYMDVIDFGKSSPAQTENDGILSHMIFEISKFDDNEKNIDPFRRVSMIKKEVMSVPSEQKSKINAQYTHSLHEPFQSNEMHSESSNSPSKPNEVQKDISKTTKTKHTEDEGVEVIVSGKSDRQEDIAIPKGELENVAKKHRFSWFDSIVQEEDKKRKSDKQI